MECAVRVLEANGPLAQLAKRLGSRSQPVFQEIKNDVQERRLTEHEKLEEALADADKEVYILSSLIKALFNREGHKYDFRGTVLLCRDRYIQRIKSQYNGVN
jgi:hypothetical protein